MTNWRPDDWDAIGLSKRPWMLTQQEAYEAGADAMLKALKEQGHKAYNNIPVETLGSPDLSRPAGWLVFIEEVE